MTPVEKYKILVDRLYQKTLEKAISWQSDPSIGTYTTISGRMILLSESRNSNGEPLEIISIGNGPEEFVDSFTDETLSDLEPPFDEAGTYWKVMQKLRTTAQRQAIGADTAIDDILSGLDDDDDAPF